MSSKGAVVVTVYERPGCHLCEALVAALTPDLRGGGVRLERVNVESDVALEARYGLAIPVVFVGAIEVARAPVDLGAVRTALADARVSGSAAN